MPMARVPSRNVPVALVGAEAVNSMFCPYVEGFADDDSATADAPRFTI